MSSEIGDLHPGGELHSKLAWRMLCVIVGLQFVASGLFSALQWESSVAFNATLTGADLATAATAAAVALLVVGGTCLVVGRGLRPGAVCILLFVIPATLRHLLVARQLSDLVGPDLSGTMLELTQLARRGQLASVSKNIALMAVLLFIFIEARAAPDKHAASKTHRHP